MMQNGFRRIALAQGLLPDRLPSREDFARVAAPEACPDVAEADCNLGDVWGRDAERVEVSAA